MKLAIIKLSRKCCLLQYIRSLIFPYILYFIINLANNQNQCGALAMLVWQLSSNDDARQITEIRMDNTLKIHAMIFICSKNLRLKSYSWHIQRYYNHNVQYQCKCLTRECKLANIPKGRYFVIQLHSVHILLHFRFLNNTNINIPEDCQNHGHPRTDRFK